MKFYKKWVDLPLYFHIIMTVIALLNLSIGNSVEDIKQISVDLSHQEKLITEDIANIELGKETKSHKLSEDTTIRFEENQVVLNFAGTEHIVAYDENTTLDQLSAEVSGIITQVYVVSLISEVIFKFLVIIFTGVALVSITTIMFKLKNKASLLAKHYSFAAVASQLTLALYLIKGINNRFVFILQIVLISILFTVSLKKTIDNSLSTYYLGGEEGI